MYTWPFWPLSVVALPLPPTRALFIDESPGSLRCAATYSTIFRLRRQIITNSTTTAKAPATNRISVTLSIFLLLLFEILDPTHFVRLFGCYHLVSVGKNCLINVITAG